MLSKIDPNPLYLLIRVSRQQNKGGVLVQGEEISRREVRALEIHARYPKAKATLLWKAHTLMQWTGANRQEVTTGTSATQEYLCRAITTADGSFVTAEENQS